MDEFNPPVEVPAGGSKQIDLVLTMKHNHHAPRYKFKLAFVSDDGTLGLRPGIEGDVHGLKAEASCRPSA